MKRRFCRTIWFLLAFALAAQSTMPGLAFATVTVRCAGAPVAAECLHSVMPLSQSGQFRSRISSLPCCRNMIRSQVMASDCRSMAGPMSQRAPATSMVRCLITVTAVRTGSTVAIGPQKSRVNRTLIWVDSGQTIRESSNRVTVATTHISSTIFVSIYLRHLASPHGLRAPPTFSN